jgi:hypothetical protein
MMSGLACPSAAKALQGKTQSASATATCFILTMSARGNAARKPRFPAVMRAAIRVQYGVGKGEKVLGIEENDVPSAASLSFVIAAARHLQ